MEIWKYIKGYEYLYQVSNKGRVKRVESKVKYSNGLLATHKERILKFDKIKKNKRGNYYLRVTLSKNNKQKRFQVHRLVAENFIKNTENKKCVNHIDGNPENNNVDNLEWCTYKHNVKCAVKYGKFDRQMISVKQICINTGNVLSIFESIREAARSNKAFERSNIAKCCRGIYKTHAGYRWEFV